MARESGSPAIELDVGHRTVRITNPGRVYFPARGETKIDLVRYYLSVGEGIVRALRKRPCMLYRFPRGVTGPKVHQKRLPAGAPPWVQTVRVDFPSPSPATSPWPPCPSGSRAWAMCTRASTRRCSRWSRCSSGPTGTHASGVRHC